MMTNEQIYSKIELLNNYALCLEHENESKSNQINTLHSHLDLLHKENQSLRATIHQFNTQNASCDHKQTSAIEVSLQTSFYLNDITVDKDFKSVQCQTQDEHIEPNSDIQEEVDALKEELADRDFKLSQYQLECEEMYDGIVTLEKQLSDKQTENQEYIHNISALQEKLSEETQKRELLQLKYNQIVQNMKNFESIESSHSSYKDQCLNMELQVESLVCENNKLIERIRQLEKEKNGYYHEVKRLSRVSFGQEQQKLGNSTFKKHNKVKDSRWKQIETNLKRLQMQNMLIQSNLQIPR